MRVGNRRDLRVRKSPRHPQRQRTPAAAEFEDRLAVGQFRMLDGLAQRLFLGLLQCRGRLLVEARGIFAVGTQYIREERGRQFIVLCIGGGGMFGNGASRHFTGKPRVAFGVAGGELRRGTRAELVDRAANDDIGQRHPLGGVDNPGDEAHVTVPLYFSIMIVAAAERTPRCAIGSRGSDRRAIEASALPAAGCR